MKKLPMFLVMFHEWRASVWRGREAAAKNGAEAARIMLVDTPKARVMFVRLFAQQAMAAVMAMYHERRYESLRAYLWGLDTRPLRSYRSIVRGDGE